LAKPISRTEMFYVSLTGKLLLLVVDATLSSIFIPEQNINWYPYNKKLHEDWPDFLLTTWSSTEKNLTKTFLNLF